MDMKNQIFNFNISPGSKLKESNIVTIGTVESLAPCSKYQEMPTGGIVTCFYSDNDSKLYYQAVEIIPTRNPFTDCCWPLTDYFENTTYFVRNDFYGDKDRLTYFLTSSAVTSFNQIFYRHGLQGDQLAVACTAFCLWELERPFYIIVHANEVALKNFCETLSNFTRA